MKSKDTTTQETFIPNFQSPQQLADNDHPMTLKELQSASNKRASQVITEPEKSNKEAEKNIFKPSLRDNATTELPESIRKVKEEIRKKVER